MLFKQVIKWVCADTILESIWNIGIRIKKRIQQRREKLFEEFRRYLEMENPTHECFLCHEHIQGKPSLHYVLPYFMVCSDNLFNLVYVHEHCRLKANEELPDKEQIMRLEERNKTLLHIMKQKGIHNIHTQELDYSIRQELLRQLRGRGKVYGGI